MENHEFPEGAYGFLAIPDHAVEVPRGDLLGKISGLLRNEGLAQDGAAYKHRVQALDFTNSNLTLY